MSGCLVAMCGGAGAAVNVLGGWVIRSQPSGIISATYELTSAGAEQNNNTGTLTTYNTWLLSGVASGYEVRATVNSGSLSSGSGAGSWLALSATRSWTVTSGAFRACSLLIEVRDKNSLAVLDSATVNLEVDIG